MRSRPCLRTASAAPTRSGEYAQDAAHWLLFSDRESKRRACSKAVSESVIRSAATRGGPAREPSLDGEICSGEGDLLDATRVSKTDATVSTRPTSKLRRTGAEVRNRRVHSLAQLRRRRV